MNRALVHSVNVILANKLSLQELNQVIGIKLLTSGFWKFFVLTTNFQGGVNAPFCPRPADAHGDSAHHCCCQTLSSMTTRKLPDTTPMQPFSYVIGGKQVMRLGF